MKKSIVKFLAAAISVAMIICALPVMSFAADSGTCGTDLTWTYADGVVTITGTGPMDNYNLNDPGWYEHADDITSVVVNNGATTIGNWAFYGYSNLSSVSLPSSLTVIGQRAFRDCGALTSVTIPANVETIQANAFYNSGLQSITFTGSSIENFTKNSISATDAKIFVPKGFTVGYQNPTVVTFENASELFGSGHTVYMVNQNATIVWENYDGTVLETDTNAAEGTTPSYDGATPEKPDDIDYTYDFIGWTPEIINVCGDMVYTAVFEAVEKPPIIEPHDINEDGSVDIYDIDCIFQIYLGISGLNPEQQAKGDIDCDGVIDNYDAIALDSLIYLTSIDPGDANGDGTVNATDYAIVKSYVSCTAAPSGENDLLSADNLNSDYQNISGAYAPGVILTQNYVSCDLNGDKVVDGLDAIFIDLYYNHVIDSSGNII